MSIHRYRIKVTQDDINAGVRNQSAHCIVATAIGMQISPAMRISVDSQTVRFSVGRERLIFLTPRILQGYVIAFDAGDFEKIKPMDVLLENPQVRATGRKPSASRLIVKGGSTQRPTAGVPSRTRAFGQRVFRVNQVHTSK